MQLITLQQNFMAYLHEPRETLATRQHAIVEMIDTTNAKGGLTRLGIYHHAYRARLLEVMQDVFERTWAYLGDDAFAVAAEAFIESAPSAGRTLNRFGESFPDWLFTRFATDGDIAEVARIDWMMRVAFDAADETPLTADALATLGPEQWPGVRFRFHPSLQIAPMAYNAASIWTALDQERIPPASEPLTAPVSLVVWRKDTRPHFITIDALEGEAISRLQRGESFGEMCEALSSPAPAVDGPDVTQALGGWLRRWLDGEMLSGLKVPD